ncbi:MAG TPA: 4Fe-4S binding protein [Desulfitobacterium dehalogenans]|uniref:4Fe-4S binding protein n=1 Tax=Desulfitobacterium dehalogenans TaxID=36854 RepID=A0A7C7D805_9FIRM|nr:4Fe-4S binding protein [Desulfitobacterium dehalogenans]
MKKEKKKALTMTLSLILVVFIGLSWVKPGNDVLSQAKEVLPEAQSFMKIASAPLTLEGISQDSSGKKEIKGYVVIEKASSYGGPIAIATGINPHGVIIGTAIIEHKDSPSFIRVVMKHGYLKQFEDKKITDPLSIKKDINAISGATYSSRGIAEAISIGSHEVARNQFGLDVEDEEAAFVFGMREGSIIFLIILMLVGVALKSDRIRWITMAGSLVLIGFQYNTPISLSNLASFLMGYLPSIRQNLVWYIFLTVIPILMFLIGKNLYCFWLCPFGALQELLAKVFVRKDVISCSRALEQKAVLVRYVLIYIALLGAVAYQSPGLAGYEPFATLFGMQGNITEWLVLAVVLFSSLFIRRFWCRFFCPGMIVNRIILRLRHHLIDFKRKFGAKLNQGCSAQNLVDK